MRTAAVMVGLLLVASLARGQTTDQRLVASLRGRGLYRLADLECQKRLESGTLSDRALVDLTIEWSLNSIAQAYDAAPAERQRHWQAAHAKLAKLIETPQQPFKLLAELQDTLNLLQQHRLERIEQLSTADREQPLARLRQAIGDLNSIASDIDRRRREIATGVAQEIDFSDRQLAGLERNVALAQADAYREQGLTYPAGSVDRVNSLQQAIEQLTPLATGSSNDNLAWQARVALARSHTELGRVAESLTLLTKWSAENPPAEHAARLFAERIEALTRSGNPDEALQATDEPSAPEGRWPAVDLARLRAMLASPSRDSGRIEPLLNAIRENHSARWIRQAEALVGQTFATEGDATSAASQSHAADHFFRAGNLAAAIAAYDQAAELSRKQGNRSQAFSAERTAAAIAAQEKDYPSATARFRRLALGSLDQPSSAADHREAILCLAAVAQQQLEASAEQSNRAYAEYLDLCREHLRHWNSGPTADEVRWWLGSALASRRQWIASIETLEQLQPSSPYYDRSVALLAKAYRSHSQSLGDKTQQRETIARATRRLQLVVLGDNQQWPAQWTATQRTCAIELARMQLSANGAAYAERILQAALTGAPAPPQTYVAEATPLLAMSLVLQKRTAEAVATLQQSSDGQSLEVLASRLLAQLTDPNDDRLQSTERAALGQLLLAALELAGDKAQSWQPPTARYRAAALAAVANYSEAQPLYAALVQQFPRDGQLQEEYARVLSSSSTADNYERALLAWGRVESGSRRGSERWLRARQARIETLTKLGRQQEADKLQKLTTLLSPR